jgi:phage shock protein PspC (stress-responsive transcriptional regulator)
MTRYRTYHMETPRRRGMLMGVCADFANAFTFDVTLVRLATLLLLCFFTGPTLLAYIVLGFLGGRR